MEWFLRAQLWFAIQTFRVCYGDIASALAYANPTVRLVEDKLPDAI